MGATGWTPVTIQKHSSSQENHQFDFVTTKEQSGSYLKRQFNLNRLTSVSIEFWISSTSKRRQTVFSIGSEKKNLEIGFEIDGGLQCFVDGKRIFSQATSSLVDGRWHHIVFTYDQFSAMLAVNGNIE